MKRLERLAVDAAEAYDACVSEIVEPSLALRFRTARTEVIAKFQEYESLAFAHNYFSIEACDRGKDLQQVLAGMTKKEFIDLYSKQMVGGRLGRNFYDRLMMLAPLGKCPFCGFGQASTLDHFLSKAHYPVLSVLCANLVPACTDCNKDKRSLVVTQENQMLHPYFEGAIVEAERWLFVEVIESVPTTVRYFVQPPDDWPADLARRVANYFRDLDLARRFAIEAASELAGLIAWLDELKTPDSKKAHLLKRARLESKNRKNSWQCALYEALAENDWFLSGGYRNQNHLTRPLDCLNDW